MALFVKIDADDTAGARPYPGTGAVWNNSSIFLEAAPPEPGEEPSTVVTQTETKEGVPTLVKVRVSSSASEVVHEDVTVDAYVMNPFAGPLRPDQAVRKLEGFANQITPGSGEPNPLDSHVITCVIKDPVLGEIPWTPTDTDLEGTTDGHYCIIANVRSETPEEGKIWKSDENFDITNDPRVGQKNIHVISDDSLDTFAFQVFGPACSDPGEPGEPGTLSEGCEQGDEFALDFRRVGAREFGASERGLLASQPDIKEVPEGSGRLFLTGRGGKLVPLTQSLKKLRGQLDLGELGTYDLSDLVDCGRRLDEAHDKRPGHRVEETLGKRPGRPGHPGGWGEDRLVLQAPPEGLAATVSVDRDDRRGSLLAFEAIVRNAEGTALGGLRLITLQK